MKPDLESPEAFLASELAKAGALSGAARTVDLDKALKDLAARLPRQGTKSVSFSKQIEVASAIDRVLVGVLYLLSRRADEVFRVEGDSELPGVFAFVPSGWLNLNLTAVLVLVTAVRTDSCTLVVSAIAREGLIIQHAAEKAVLRLEGDLNHLLA